MDINKQDIPLDSLVATSAEMVLDGFMVEQKIWENLKSSLGSNSSDQIKTEVILTLLFIGQIVLQTFLLKKQLPKEQLSEQLSHYTVEAYQLLVQKYHYFNEAELILFEKLIHTRYPEYYDAMKEKGFSIEILVNSFSLKNNIDNVVFAAALNSILLSCLTTISEFLNESGEKFNIV